MTATRSDTPEASRPSRQRMTRPMRRASIIEAARSEFARGGYHGASTASIAREAGCSEPMLYKHFEGKLALFLAAIEAVSDDLDALFRDLMSVDGPLLDTVIAALPQLMADPTYREIAALRSMAGAIADEPGVRDTVAEYLGRHGHRIELAVQRAMDEGQVRTDVTAGYVAWMWVGMTQAACFRDRIEEGGFELMLPHMQTFFESLRA